MIRRLLLAALLATLLATLAGLAQSQEFVLRSDDPRADEALDSSFVATLTLSNPTSVQSGQFSKTLPSAGSFELTTAQGIIPWTFPASDLGLDLPPDFTITVGLGLGAGYVDIDLDAYRVRDVATGQPFPIDLDTRYLLIRTLGDIGLNIPVFDGLTITPSVGVGPTLIDGSARIEIPAGTAGLPVTISNRNDLTSLAWTSTAALTGRYARDLGSLDDSLAGLQLGLAARGRYTNTRSMWEDRPNSLAEGYSFDFYRVSYGIDLQVPLGLRIDEMPMDVQAFFADHHLYGDATYFTNYQEIGGAIGVGLEDEVPWLNDIGIDSFHVGASYVFGSDLDGWQVNLGYAF